MTVAPPDPDGPTTRCPCGSGRPYDRCCGPLHRGTTRAATAEQVMRARYSAFARGDEAYLAASWDPATRPRRLHVTGPQRWLRLEVLATTGGGLLDDEGTVEFRAHHDDGSGPAVLHERSAFVRHDGAWVYRGPAPEAPGRPR